MPSSVSGFNGAPCPGALRQAGNRHRRDARERGFKGAAHERLETVEKDHGRIETLRYWITSQIDWPTAPDWEGITSIGMVESVREIEGKTTSELRFYLCRAFLEKNFRYSMGAPWAGAQGASEAAVVTYCPSLQRSATAHAAPANRKFFSRDALASRPRAGVRLFKRSGCYFYNTARA